MAALQREQPPPTAPAVSVAPVKPKRKRKTSKPSVSAPSVALPSMSRVIPSPEMYS